MLISVAVSLFSCNNSTRKYLSFVFSGETILLAFQHYILILGTTVMIPSMLVPLMGGTNVSRICVGD